MTRTQEQVLTPRNLENVANSSKLTVGLASYLFSVHVTKCNNVQAQEHQQATHKRLKQSPMPFLETGMIVIPMSLDMTVYMWAA